MCAHPGKLFELADQAETVECLEQSISSSFCEGLAARFIIRTCHETKTTIDEDGPRPAPQVWQVMLKTVGWGQALVDMASVLRMPNATTPPSWMELMCLQVPMVTVCLWPMGLVK